METAESTFEPARPGVLATAVFFLATASLTWPMALGQFLVNPFSDQYAAGYSFRAYGAEMFRATWSIPEWNPYLFGGLPFVGAMHGDIFYPTAWLRWILPTDMAMNLGFAVHILLAGVCTYALLRALKLPWTAAVVGGLAYQLTGMITSLVNPGHDGKMFVAALTPLAFLALLRAVRDQRFSWYGVFALVVGLALVSPHYQLTYYLLVASGLWTLYLAFVAPERPPSHRWYKSIGFAAAAVFLGFLISAIQAFPFLDYIQYSPRGSGGASVGWQYSIGFSMPPEELMSTILPQFNGVVENYWGRNFFKLHSEFLGGLVVILAIFAWGSKAHRSLLWAMTGIGSFFLLISLGGHTPFYRLWYEVMPMMKSVRAPGMAFFLVSFPVAVAAAIGTEQLLERRIGRGFFWTVLGVFAGIAVLGLAGMLQPVAEALAPAQNAERVAANADALRMGSFRLLVMVLAGGAIAWTIRDGKLRGAVAAAALILAVGADLWSVEREFFRFSPPAAELYATDEIIDQMRTTEPPYRVLNFGVYDRSYLMAFQIQSVLGYHGNELRFYDDLWGGKNEWRHLGMSQLWDLLAVQYVLLPSVEEIPGYSRVLGPVQTTPGGFGVLFERDSTAPYVRVYPAALKVPDEQIVPTVINPQMPYNTVLLVSDTVAADVPALEGLPAPTAVTASLAHWAPGEMAVDLDGDDQRQTYLLVSETWHPDWHATVDGEPVTPVRGQGALTAVPLPPGARRVDLRFASSRYRLGMLVSLAAVLLALVVAVVPAGPGETSCPWLTGRW